MEGKGEKGPDRRIGEGKGQEEGEERGGRKGAHPD